MADAHQDSSGSFSRFFFGLAIIVMVVLPFVLSPAYLERLLNAERASIQMLLGDAEEEIYEASYTSPPQEIETGLVDLASQVGSDKPIHQWASERVTVVWLWGTLLNYRITMLFSWMLCTLPLIVGAFIDGYFVRETRKFSFFSQSPIRHKVAVRGAISAFVSTFLFILTPLAFPPLLMPLSLLGIGVAAWYWISNLQKRL